MTSNEVREQLLAVHSLREIGRNKRAMHTHVTTVKKHTGCRSLRVKLHTVRAAIDIEAIDLLIHTKHNIKLLLSQNNAGKRSHWPGHALKRDCGCW